MFVKKLELGLNGTALATLMTTSINTLSINLYITFYLTEIKEAWFLPTKDSFKGISEYFKIAIPSMLMGCLEWWTFEI